MGRRLARREVNVERLIDRGDEVIALIHGSYRLSAEGQPNDYAHGWTLRDGKAEHARALGSRELPPEALGANADAGAEARPTR